MEKGAKKIIKIAKHLYALASCPRWNLFSVHICTLSRHLVVLASCVQSVLLYITIITVLVSTTLRRALEYKARFFIRNMCDFDRSCTWGFLPLLLFVYSTPLSNAQFCYRRCGQRFGYFGWEIPFAVPPPPPTLSVLCARVCERDSNFNRIDNFDLQSIFNPPNRIF